MTRTREFMKLAGVAAVVAALAGLGPARDAQAQPQDLIVVTGNTGGTFYPVGVGIAKILSDAGMRASADVGGGNSNVITVSAGKAQIGMTFSPTVVFAQKGDAPFKSPVNNLKALGALYVNVTHVAVTKESGVATVAELKGKPFASQPLSAGSATFFRMVLEANGLTEDDLDIVVRGGPAQGAQATRDRRAIGFQATAGAPNGAFSEAFVSLAMTLLPIEDAAFAKINGANPGLGRAVIPAGTYDGLEKDVPTIGASTIMIVNEAMSDDDAYAITKALIENVETLKGIHAALGGLSLDQMPKVEGIDLHPGSARAYKEAGL